MKRCPTCQRPYADDLMFCVEDAQALEPSGVQTLADLLATSGPLSVPRALAVGRGLCDAFAAVHARGRVPPPVTPLDVEMSGDTVHVTFADDATPTVRDATALDPTAPYAAPEASGGSARDEAASVYHVGALVFAALTGSAPFAGTTSAAVAVRKMVEDAPSARALRAEVPESVDACVTRAMAREPSERFATLSALRDALVAAPAAPSLAPPAMAAPAPAFAAAAPAAAAPVAAARPRGAGRGLMIGGAVLALGAGALLLTLRGGTRRSEVPMSSAAAPQRSVASPMVPLPTSTVAVAASPPPTPEPAAMPAVVPLAAAPPTVEPVRPRRHAVSRPTLRRTASGGGMGNASPMPASPMAAGASRGGGSALSDELGDLAAQPLPGAIAPLHRAPRRTRPRPVQGAPSGGEGTAPRATAELPTPPVTRGGTVQPLPTESVVATREQPSPPPPPPVEIAPQVVPSVPPPAPPAPPPAHDTSALLAVAAALATLGIFVVGIGAWRLRRRPAQPAPVWSPAVPLTQVVVTSPHADPYGSTLHAAPQPPSAVWCLRCNQPCPADARFCPHDGADLQAQGSLSAPVAAAPPAHAHDVAMRPFIVGAYRCEARLGEGGMGVVYKAQHTTTGQPCAVKVLLLRGRNDGAQIERFRREARLAASIRHPRSVAIYDYGEVNGQLFFLAMELLDGRSLDQVADRRALPVARVASIVAQVCDCLAAAHAAGVVHRDLKPQNVMILAGRDGDAVKLVDFGIARDLHAQSQTLAGTIVGTPGYMAPEQARGDAAVDARADVFSVGVMAWELLTGRPPFDAAGTAIQQVFKRALLRDPAPPVTAANPALPPALDAVLARATHPDVALRTPDVGRLAQEFLAAAQPAQPAWQAAR